MALNGLIYDLIVIGESQEGLDLIKELYKLNSELKILLISSTVSKQVKGVEAIERTVVDAQYSYGVAVAIISYTEAYLAKNLVFATGQIATKLMNEPDNNVYYNVKAIKKGAKNVVVFGNNANTINEAISISRKADKVFICEESNSLAQLVEKQIEPRYDNISYLPMSKIQSYEYDVDGKLNKVYLSTLAELPCDALYVSLGKKPDTATFSSRMLKLDEEGYIIVENGLIPGVDNVYAIGKCTKYNVKNTEKTLESLKNKFKKENK